MKYFCYTLALVGLLTAGAMTPRNGQEKYVQLMLAYCSGAFSILGGVCFNPAKSKE